MAGVSQQQLLSVGRELEVFGPEMTGGQSSQGLSGFHVPKGVRFGFLRGRQTRIEWIHCSVAGNESDQLSTSQKQPPEMMKSPALIARFDRNAEGIVSDEHSLTHSSSNSSSPTS